MPSQRSKAARVNIYLPPKHKKVADEIENLSNFFQIALDNASDIMAWALLKDYDPKKYYSTKKFDEVVGDFNEKFPADPLGKKMKGEEQCPKPSPKNQELW